MRWDKQLVDAVDGDALPGMTSANSVLRSFEAPEFRGMQFLEVATKTALNKVPGTGMMGGAVTINPYRGCQHACVYCFARKTHTYLDLDAGTDFDTRIVVKVNVGEVLAKELRSRRPERVMLGTNTDPYQRAEGRYRLLPKIIGTLVDHGVGISVLTKGSLIRRDLPLLAEAATQVPVDISLSIAIFDDDLQQRVEPGTPSTNARLATLRAVRAAGLDCGILAMPILPGLTDSAAHLDTMFAQLSAAGATSITVGPLHLRPGAREWWFSWLRREHPSLVPLHERLYAKGSTVSSDYATDLDARVSRARSGHRLAPRRQEGVRRPRTGPTNYSPVTPTDAPPDTLF